MKCIFARASVGNFRCIFNVRAVSCSTLSTVVAIKTNYTCICLLVSWSKKKKNCLKIYGANANCRSSIIFHIYSCEVVKTWNSCHIFLVSPSIFYEWWEHTKHVLYAWNGGFPVLQIDACTTSLASYRNICIKIFRQHQMQELLPTAMCSHFIHHHAETYHTDFNMFRVCIRVRIICEKLRRKWEKKMRTFHDKQMIWV